jgi:hypothetical protein
MTNDELDALEKRKRELIEATTKLAEQNEKALADWLEANGYRSIHNEQQREIASLRRQLAEIDAALNAAGQVTLTGEQPRPFTQRIADLHAEYLRRHKAACDEWLRAEEIQSQLAAEREAHANMASAIAKLEEAVFAERERADSIAQESAETLVQAEKWEVSCGEQTRRLGTALVERDAAQADARGLRELLKEARDIVEHYADDLVSASVEKETRAFLARIDAKLTEGA